MSASRIRQLCLTRRTWSHVELVGVALIVAAFVVAFLPGHAYAASPTVTLAPGPPYTDGQSVTVSGSGFPPRSQNPTGMSILECADPGGTIAGLPIDNTTCDGTTLNPLPIPVDSTGAFTATYNLAALSPPTSNINCDATDFCVLWVGIDYVNSFTSNDAFSAPFEITGGTTSTTTTSSTTTTTSPGGTTTTASTTSTAPTTTTTTAPTTTTTTAATTTTTSPTETTTSTTLGGTTTTTLGGTTTTGVSGGTTSTTGLSGTPTTGPSGGGGVSGGTGAGPVTGGSGSLAFTGPPGIMLWLIGAGALLTILGALGRRAIPAPRAVTVALEATRAGGVSGPDVPITMTPRRTGADRTFMILLMAASGVVLIAIGAILAFLIGHSVSAARYAGLSVITSQHFSATGTPHFGLLGVLLGTLTIAVLALVVAVPISLSAALMINEYAPRRARRALTALIDLLAVLPSVLYGIWGLEVFTSQSFGVTVWLSTHANFIPLFHDPDQTYGNSIFLCGIVVGIMIIPIVTSVSREVMAQAPRDACEAALALGGTKWGMVTDVILPFARNGILGGILLGLGRALGETVAVLLILSQTNLIHWQILSPGGGDIPALIANFFVSVPALSESGLTLAGLLLFSTILLINFMARRVIGRPQVRIV